MPAEVPTFDLTGWSPDMADEFRGLAMQGLAIVAGFAKEATSANAVDIVTVIRLVVELLEEAWRGDIPISRVVDEWEKLGAGFRAHAAESRRPFHPDPVEKK